MTALTKPPKVTIDGEPVTAYGPLAWPLTFGVTAPEVLWSVDQDTATRVLRKREITIRVEPAELDSLDEQHDPCEIEHVLVLGEGPTRSSREATLVLSDLRWTWRHAWIRRSWNLRRRIGYRKRLEATSTYAQAQQLSDEVVFAAYSIDETGKRAITPEEMLKRVLDKVSPGRWASSVKWPDKITPNDVEIDDPAYVAIGHLMAAIGAVDCYVNLAGILRILSRIPGDEAILAEKMAPYEFEGRGVLTWIHMPASRPERVVVGFTRQPEVRTDAVEGLTFTLERGEPWSENVVEVTTPTLKDASGQIHEQGQWLEVSKFLAALAFSNNPLVDPEAGPLTLAKIRDGFVGSNLHLQYTIGTGRTPSVFWGAVISAILRDYRQTYRLNPDFVSRCVPGTIEFARVGVADPIHGLRARSPVYLDHCKKPTLLYIGQNSDQDLGWNVDSFPWRTGVPATLSDEKLMPTGFPALADLREAPFDVVPLDPEIGVFRIQPRLDGWGEAELVIPSRVIGIPTERLERIANATAHLTWEECSLNIQHRFATIISAVPAGPNDERQLHLVPVSPAEALAKLGLGQLAAQGFDGAEQMLRVGGSLARARWIWEDAHRAELLSFFGIGAQAGGGAPQLEPSNAPELLDYARAVAAVHLAGLLDHYEGVQTIALDTRLEPLGSVHTVTHLISEDGTLWTTLDANPFPPALAPETLLSASTRRTLLREGVHS